MNKVDWGSVTVGTMPPGSTYPHPVKLAVAPDLMELQEHASVIQKRIADVLTENDELRRRVASLEEHNRELAAQAHQHFKVMEDQIRQGLDRDVPG